MHASLSVCCLPIHTLKFGAFASASPNVHRFVRSFVIPLLMALVGMGGSGADIRHVERDCFSASSDERNHWSDAYCGDVVLESLGIQSDTVAD